jgi:hypothetical protein
MRLSTLCVLGIIEVLDVLLYSETFDEIADIVQDRLQPLVQVVTLR